jgi:hypothetical protein
MFLAALMSRFQVVPQTLLRQCSTLWIRPRATSTFTLRPLSLSLDHLVDAATMFPNRWKHPWQTQDDLCSSTFLNSTLSRAASLWRISLMGPEHLRLIPCPWLAQFPNPTTTKRSLGAMVVRWSSASPDSAGSACCGTPSRSGAKAAQGAP